MGEYVQIFNEGSFVEGDLTWGWQCFRCKSEETGFGSATTAAEGRDNHESLGCDPTEGGEQCRCPDPQRAVSAICPIHGHSPERAYPPPAPMGARTMSNREDADLPEWDTPATPVDPAYTGKGPWS